MSERIDYENIFTPQGMLGHVSKQPNLDFLMNIFNIPRVYSVSGFGTWNVGQHTMAVAFLVLYWSAFNHYPQEKRDRLALQAELKLLDMISFLYEISQSSPKGIDPTKRKLLKQMYARQKEDILAYAEKAQIDSNQVKDFLKSMKL